ncbi:hypothetical protein [Nostoc sp. DSM 114161]
MDVELQILKHLARDPHPTVAIACRPWHCYYQNLYLAYREIV